MVRFAFWKGVSDLGGQTGLQRAGKLVGADGTP